VTEERRGFGLGRFLAFAAIILVIVAASGIFPFRQIIAQNRSVDLAQAKLDALLAENVRLEQQLAALESPAEVERLAREQFGLVMPGEVAYVAVVPEGSSQTDSAVIPGGFEHTKPWWQSFWDFVTGTDLVTDG
jgi:cell division protein FtsL